MELMSTGLSQGDVIVMFELFLCFRCEDGMELVSTGLSQGCVTS